MKIQISKDKSIDWTPPWERQPGFGVSDVVGIEFGSANPRGCPAVRIRRQKKELYLLAVGYVPAPELPLPKNWDELHLQPKWTLPSAFRAEGAAIAVNSPESFTRQSTLASFEGGETSEPMGAAYSKKGFRMAYGKMADEVSALHTGMPEFQALWLSRLLPEGRRPTAVSVQTQTAALLSSLSAQPGFCAEGDEAAVFVGEDSILLASYRNGIPLLFRECPGSVGAATMRAAIRQSLGIDDSMLDTVFSSAGIIDTRPALEPILTPVLSQIEITIDYLRGRLGSNVSRIFVMGDPPACESLCKMLNERSSIPTLVPNPFQGLEMPLKSAAWKDEFCHDGAAHPFLVALGAALAALKGEP